VHVLGDLQRFNLLLGDAMHDAAGGLGALGRVLGQVSGDPAALIDVEAAGVSSSPERTVPPPSSAGSGARTSATMVWMASSSRSGVKRLGGGLSSSSR
jgi:hypothetical protein